MIELTKINNEVITINSDEIEIVESNFETIITFRSGRKIAVKERSDEITEKIVNFKKRILPETE
jgi:flagellar protein FlbD